MKPFAVRFTVFILLPVLNACSGSSPPAEDALRVGEIFLQDWNLHKIDDWIMVVRPRTYDDRLTVVARSRLGGHVVMHYLDSKRTIRRAYREGSIPVMPGTPVPLDLDDACAMRKLYVHPKLLDTIALESAQYGELKDRNRHIELLTVRMKRKDSGENVTMSFDRLTGEFLSCQVSGPR